MSDEEWYFLPSFLIFIFVGSVAWGGLVAMAADTVNVDGAAVSLLVEPREDGSWQANYAASFQAEPGAGVVSFRVVLRKYHDGQLVGTLADREVTVESDPEAYCREGCALDTCLHECWILVDGQPVRSRCERWQWCAPDGREHRCSCRGVSSWTLEVEWGEGDELRLSVEPGPGAHDVDPGNDTLTVQYGN